MREANDPADIDAENFYRLVLIVRAIAVSRPHNLAKFAEQYANKSIDESTGMYHKSLMFLNEQMCDLKLFVSSTCFRKRTPRSSFEHEGRCKSTSSHPIDGDTLVSTYGISQKYGTCSSSRAGTYAH